MKKERILNLEQDASKELIEKALLNVCTKNKRLSSFIKKVFKNNQDRDILAFDDEGAKFDIECGDGGHYEPTELFFYNEDYVDEESGDDGWFPEDVHFMFDKYFRDFDWDSITLDNGKILILTDMCEYLSFQILDLKNLEDGKADEKYIESIVLTANRKILNN